MEVLASSAYEGEVGTVLEVPGAGLYYLRFEDGSEAVFVESELRSSQQKLDLPRGVGEQRPPGVLSHGMPGGTAILSHI